MIFVLGIIAVIIAFLTAFLIAARGVVALIKLIRDR